MDLPMAAPVPSPSPADEPVAAVVVGAAANSRRAVLTAFLDGESSPDLRPPESFLVIRHGTVERTAAYLPGWSQPWIVPARSARSGAGLALPRPPRRVEVSRPDASLRRLSLVDSPDLETLRSAGATVLLDAAVRGGALVFVVGAGPPPGQVEHELLRRALRAGVAVFVAITAAGVQSAGESFQRAALLAAVPELEQAPWHSVDAATGDAAFLRREVTDWAAREALHRAGAGLADQLAYDEPPPLPPGGPAADWSEQLDRVVRRIGQRVRHTLAIELANLHVAAVRELLFGNGPAGIPGFLDREFLALSLHAGAACAVGVDDAVDEVVEQVFGVDPAQRLGPLLREQLRRRVLGDPPTAVAEGLLTTAAGQCEPVPSTAAGPSPVTGPSPVVVDVFAGYPAQRSRCTVPPIGVALAADCWHPRGGPTGMAPDQARSWIQQALRAVEIALSQEIALRFAAVRRGLANLLADAIDSGDAPG
ncbi:hypothetical protein O7543_12975 [Solwaraspora sp. WMMA2080]|uniref:hypothetical protein n=1 Tax=unclassified Solwaraspora TaxID=2627926 RepID=UPI00248B7AFA|nr:MULTISPECIES: hypothetical protein [unclassified Solwaraspora]WBB98190.1 hypothetical protein O7553_04385 [Solwaraspora sp. WMMA2059]WBC23256.1 hypothetical protein O7543_12975 [Solwaraspora sp. WMMA2080]